MIDRDRVLASVNRPMRERLWRYRKLTGPRYMRNAALVVLVVVLTVSVYLALTSNGKRLAGFLNPSEEVVALTPPPVANSESIVSGTFSHAAMNTEFVFTLYGRPGDTHVSSLERIAKEAFSTIDDLESRLSSWIPGSQVSRINEAAGRDPVRVSADIMNVVQAAKALSKETEGAFDITVGPLLELWGFYDKEGKEPSDAEIRSALGKIGAKKIVVSPRNRTIYLKTKGMRLNFGGIGKGLALDQAAEVLRGYGITSALLHGGTSTVVAIGSPPGEDHWTVHVRDPYNRSQYIDTVYLSDMSLSTSGCYGEQLDIDGKPICHILDPRTGRPVQGALSVSVVAPTGTRSDGLSTGFMVWGKENIEKYCRRHPQVGAIFVGVPDHGKPVPVRINLEKERALQ